MFEEESGFSEAQEFDRCYPQERFLVTYIGEENSKYGRIVQYVDNVAAAGSVVSFLQGQGIDTVQVFKLEEYPIARAIAVHEKKQNRAMRKGAKREKK